MNTEDAILRLGAGDPPEIESDVSGWVSSGSVMLNLSLTDSPDRAFPKGRLVLLVGQSRAGKTMAALTALACAANNRKFKKYHLYYDAPEDGAEMLTPAHFGEKAVGRIKEPPLGHSEDIEGYYYNMDELKTPYISVLDSMDALDSRQVSDKFVQRKNAYLKKMRGERPNKVAGDYGDGKAKINSYSLRRVRNRLRQTDSLAIIIAQSRDSLDEYGDPETRSGGRALTFYAHFELWFKYLRKETKSVLGKDREIGTWCRITPKKNRQTGRRNPIDLLILHDHGIDDTGSMIHWLTEEGVFKRESKTRIRARPIGLTGSLEDLVVAVEADAALRSSLVSLVCERWWAVRDGSATHRKPKFGD